MGIDWENILGDKSDVTDAYDSLVFDSERHTDYDEIPDEFDPNLWYKDATGKDTTENLNEYVAAYYVLDKYVEFLKENHNKLPKTALGKAFAFFMTAVGGRIMAADQKQTNTSCKGSAEEVICDANDGLLSRTADIPKETTYIEPGINDEAAKIIKDTFCDYLKKHDYYDNAFMTVYNFVEECGRKDADSDYITDDLDENMVSVYSILGETWYQDINWNVFEAWDTNTEKLLGKFR